MAGLFIALLVVKFMGNPISDGIVLKTEFTCLCLRRNRAKKSQAILASLDGLRVIFSRLTTVNSTQTS